MSTIEKIDVVIIGAGPSGSSAAALLRKRAIPLRSLKNSISLVFRLVSHCYLNLWHF